MRGLHRQFKLWLDPWLPAEQAQQVFRLAPLHRIDAAHLGGEVIWLPENPLAAASQLYEQMLLAQSLKTSLDLNYQRYQLQALGEARLLSRETLLGAMSAQSRLTWRFVSPTALSSGKTVPVLSGGIWRPGVARQTEAYLLPDPFRIFHALLFHWNSFAEVRSFPHRVLALLDQSVEIEACHVQTQRVVLGYAQRKPMTFRGFCGEMQLHCRSRDRDLLQIFQALGQYACLAGIGRKTAMGMGAVQLSAGAERPRAETPPPA